MIEKQEEAPLASRLKSKIFKTRQTAYEELADLFKSKENNDPSCAEQVPELPEYIIDSNPGAQEKALICMKAYLESTDRVGFSLRDCLKALFEKCLSQTKPSLKRCSNEILLNLFEKGDRSVVIEMTIEMLQNKNQTVFLFIFSITI